MHSQEILIMLRHHPRKKLVLDSNLLLLWITARYDLRLLSSFKRVQMFTQTDAELLAWIIDQFTVLVTTPHIVTEASNLANSLTSYARPGWFKFLQGFAMEVVEETPALRSLAEREEFVRFGVTDCALSSLASEHLIVTTDYRFSNYTASRGVPIINFYDLRKMLQS
jgi:predicted nucleic acid-binding protein